MMVLSVVRISMEKVWNEMVSSAIVFDKRASMSASIMASKEVEIHRKIWKDLHARCCTGQEVAQFKASLDQSSLRL